MLHWVTFWELASSWGDESLAAEVKELKTEQSVGFPQKFVLVLHIGQELKTVQSVGFPQ